MQRTRIRRSSYATTRRSDRCRPQRKTLGVSALNGIYTLSTRSWMDAHGGDSTTLKELEFPTGSSGDACSPAHRRGRAWPIPELQDALESGKFRVVTHNYDAIARCFMYAGWFCTTDFLAKQRPVVDAFARAMREAAIYVNAHPTEAVPVLAKFAGYDPPGSRGCTTARMRRHSIRS